MVRKKFDSDQVLSGNWQAFCKTLPMMSENEVADALRHERNTEKRREYMFRLHRKFTRLRYKREQKEMGLL